MKSKLTSLIIAVIIVIVIVAGGAFVLLAGSKKKTTTTTPTSHENMDHSSSTTTDTSHDTTPAATSSVSIEGFAYKPAEITVKKGTKVTWTNKDSVGHTVTSSDKMLDSPMLQKDESFTYTFDTVGSFSYICTPHPYMKGKVIVTE